MRAKFAILIACAGMLGSALPVLAHHSFAAEYDASKPVELHGTVTKLEWTNPHARIYLAVKDANGTVTEWNLGARQPQCARAERLDAAFAQRRRCGHDIGFAREGWRHDGECTYRGAGGWQESIRRLGNRQRPVRNCGNEKAHRYFRVWRGFCVCTGAANAGGSGDFRGGQQCSECDRTGRWAEASRPRAAEGAHPASCGRHGGSFRRVERRRSDRRYCAGDAEGLEASHDSPGREGFQVQAVEGRSRGELPAHGSTAHLSLSVADGAGQGSRVDPL